MKFRVGLFASVSVLSYLGANVGHAADLLPPPPPPQYVEVVDGGTSCMYGRVDVGGSFHQRPTVSKGGAAVNPKINSHAFGEVGAGCQVTDNMRIEVTGGYRMRASLTDTANTLKADLETYTGFLHAFWDITNYEGFTPYLGGGVGFAHHRFLNVNLPGTASAGSNTSIAYDFTAGVAYDLSSNLMVDVAYRYVDLGVAKSSAATTIRADDLISHEVKVGLRYKFDAW